MSMEVKKMDEWRNIKKLIALRWRNRSFVRSFLCFLGVSLVMESLLVFSLWKSGGYHVDSWTNLTTYGGFENFAIIVFVAGILLRMGSVLNEDSVGMYPGLVRTRYISRILSDWLLMAVFIVENGLLNLVVTGAYALMAKVTGNFGKVLMLGNIGVAMILTFLFVLAIYSVILFLQTLYERIGVVKFWIGTLVVIVLVFLELLTPFCIFDLMCETMNQFLQQGNSLVKVGIVSFVVFVVFMIFSLWLVQGIRSWKKENATGGKMIACCLVLFVVGFGAAISMTDTGVYEWNFSEGTLEQQIENGDYFAEDSVQTCVVDHKIMKNLNQQIEQDVTFSIQWVSLEEAKKLGIANQDLSLQKNEICIRTVVKNCEVQGTSLTEGFLNAKLTIENGQYQVKEPLKVVLQNNYLRLFTNQFLSDEDIHNLEKMEDSNLANFLGYFVIYNEEDIAESAVPMSLSAGSALDEFVWELQE